MKKDRVQWAVIGLEPGLPDWTNEETTISYQGYQLTLRPETEDRLATIAIPFVAPQTYQEAVKAGYRFLSAFAWLHDGRGRVESNGTSGGGFPIWLGKSAWQQRHRPDFGRRFRLDSLQEPAFSESRTWLALALYREARYVNSVPYEFLGYFRIINILAATGRQQIAWIGNALSIVKDHDALERLQALKASEPDVPEYLYESGRCAVAHAHGDPVVDPDEPGDVMRLRQDMPVVRALAEYAIEHALGVKSSQTIYGEHLYQLAGFRDLFGDALVERLKVDDLVTAGDLPSLSALSLRFRDEPVMQAFEGMEVVQVHVEKGVVWLLLQSEDRLARAILGLNLRAERLLIDFENGIRVGDDGSSAAVEKELDRIRMLECCLSNGELEVWDGAKEKLLGRTDAIIPVNIDSARTADHLRERTAALKAHLERRHSQPKDARGVDAEGVALPAEVPENSEGTPEPKGPEK